ncbi:hypothetical protein A2382_03480 [Candidatus Woesebacteria bacterium RIFOXYB1_FULL_38_16]|uniref:Uncharacterized protein n=1 Tax=Candidatus Woesebacteria bacterium RIFOXYB1_FULL_38_16 TaxID=1802538 RepID=A0A1F8CT59_9BACT|nr:MAG: hypothetical protein A2191_03765 [Candidatus Woesebacteria bacterium RIFOXYA1_FULL_38_9]OGM78928.1 MAG: hypothetical protein A2382_03480 [Candidatus Woesebacteria bacterium RIFOXYB1_FULL_38_16]
MSTTELVRVSVIYGANSVEVDVAPGATVEEIAQAAAEQADLIIDMDQVEEVLFDGQAKAGLLGRQTLVVTSDTNVVEFRHVVRHNG